MQASLDRITIASSVGASAPPSPNTKRRGNESELIQSPGKKWVRIVRSFELISGNLEESMRTMAARMAGVGAGLRLVNGAGS